MEVIGYWGTWTGDSFCPAGSFVNGFWSKVDQSGPLGDFQGITEMWFRCSDAPVNTTLASAPLPLGTWDPAGFQECPGGYSAIKAEIQSPQVYL